MLALGRVKRRTASKTLKRGGGLLHFFSTNCPEGAGYSSKLVRCSWFREGVTASGGFNNRIHTRHFVGLNDVIINLRITSRLPFGFTQLATQGDSKDKIPKPLRVKMGSFHVIHDVINISSITFKITFPVSKSRHVSGTALKHDHKHAASAHDRFSEITLLEP